MNVLLLKESDFIELHKVARISDYRFEHVRSILKLKAGDCIRVGILRHNLGQAEVINISDRHLDLRIVHLDDAPPPVLPLTLLLALPRPKMLQRTLQTVATMGVSNLILMHTERVEKSFWQSPALSTDNIENHFILGAEQARATHIPALRTWQKKQDVWHGLPELMHGKKGLIAHPGEYPFIQPADVNQHTVMAIGPEGGFTEREYEQFVGMGFSPVQLGPRILRVETAVPVIIGKLF